MVRAASVHRIGTRARGLRREGQAEDPHQGGKTGRLGTDGHETGHRGGSTLVHIRRPHMEGHSCHLEAKTNQQQGSAHQQQNRIGRAFLDGSQNPRQTGVGSGAKDHGRSKKDETGGKCSQQEIFQRGLFRSQLWPGEPGQDVQRDG